MKAVYFRVIFEDGTPTGYVGFVTYTNSKDMFLAIDEFADPYSVEIKDAPLFGFCMKVTKFDDEEYATSEYEVSDHIPCPYENDGWMRPKYPPLEDIYTRPE